MNKFQPIKFHSIEDFLAHLPDHERTIVDRLREIVWECLPPNGREKLAYNVPFFYLHTRICFIWPASVPWGNVKLNGVQLGFSRGHLLEDEWNYLEKGGRKQVYVKTFHDLKEIETDILKAYLFQAIELDKLLKKTK